MVRLVAFILLFTFAEIKPGDATPAGAPETIRVAIVKGGDNVTLSGEGILAVQENGAPVMLSYPVTPRRVRDGITVDGKIYHSLRFSSSNVLVINDKSYRGFAEVVENGKELLVINELPLEEYLVGLINSEISSTWPIEAVKAQAVIARTYALYRKETRKTALYHLESTVLDQVYDGTSSEDSRAYRGVMETSGEVLTYNNSIIQAFYHSNCGGSTESSENVWGFGIPYLRGVDCQYCRTSPSGGFWEMKLTLQKIESLLKTSGLKISGVTGIRAGDKNSRGRLKQVIVNTSRGDVVIKAVDFRKAIGFGPFKSTNFSVRVENGEVLFRGTGNGHGVGLCQWGAKQRALDGFGYAEIVAYYYPGTELKKLSDIR